MVLGPFLSLSSLRGACRQLYETSCVGNSPSEQRDGLFGTRRFAVCETRGRPVVDCSLFVSGSRRGSNPAISWVQLLSIAANLLDSGPSW